MGSSSATQVGIRTPENFMTPALYGKLISDPKHVFCVAHVSTDCKLNRGSVERHKKGKHRRTVSAG
ncbi:hypothetical protein HPG69_017728, partial [Diceros bicornis minor]